MKNNYIESIVQKIQDRQKVENSERTLASAYESSVRKGFEVITFSEIIWENDVETLVEALEKAEIKEIYLTTPASNMLEICLMFDGLGLKLQGVIRLENPEYKQEMKQYGRSNWSPTIPAMKFVFEHLRRAIYTL